MLKAGHNGLAAERSSSGTSPKQWPARNWMTRPRHALSQVANQGPLGRGHPVVRGHQPQGVPPGVRVTPFRWTFFDGFDLAGKDVFMGAMRKRYTPFATHSVSRMTDPAGSCPGPASRYGPPAGSGQPVPRAARRADLSVKMKIKVTHGASEGSTVSCGSWLTPARGRRDRLPQDGPPS